MRHINRPRPTLSDLLPQEPPVAPSIWPRRVFHVLAGSTIPMAVLFAPSAWVQWVLVIGAVLAVAIELGRGLLPPINDFALKHLPFFKPQEKYEVTGSTYLILTAMVAFFLFEKEFVVLAFVFLAVGDPLAALVGRWDHRLRFFGKSLVGTAAFTIGAAAAGYLVALHPDIPAAWWVLPGALVAAVAELLPFPVDDNITIPLASASAMTLLVLL